MTALRSEPGLVFGAVSLGMGYGLSRTGAGANAIPSEADAAALIEHALDVGITTFDTAPVYGESEARLGRVLGTRGQVWTKVAPGTAPDVSLAASLARLRRPHIELMQWHNWTADLDRDASWRAAWLRLRDDERVGALGATTYGVMDAVAAAESGLFDVVQCEYNLLNQSVVSALADHASSRRISVAVRSVFLQGALTDEGRELPALPALRSGVARARAAAGTAGLTRLALRAALESPAVSYVLVGIDRRGQLEEAVEIAKGLALSSDERAGVASLDLGGDPACDPRAW